MRTQADYEALLAAEGLAPLDDGGHARTAVKTAVAGDDAQDARSRYLAWARIVLRTVRFTSEHQRRVWELYAAGKSIGEIQRALGPGRESRTTQAYRLGVQQVTRSRVLKVGVSRRSVTRALDRVRRLAPLPPVPHPHRKRPAQDGTTAARGQALESLVTKVLARLRRSAADAGELQRILEASMGKEIATVKYERIRLREPIDLPGISVGKDVLLGIDGRPHAGGIDVVVKGKDGKGTPVNFRRTIPWWNIKWADVGLGEEPGE